ncbi:YggS family pyridoxal phosphate-dependent enzyme [Labilibaculum sp. K2S]|uniref:YggS family pyridoxal phosphate-dependent enzyme n=1 Tax=Labilibaculum sp. K2S TaxID=3056386 RepID=UPI0025A390A0|nr:YggS family pyridoxal phosphate-dependent enzyme [Labilibaculum sp. K2S]MDM8158197.1 YggS family pyridoxal phosphate-dependent enzyme [Labilibaculum sp. K2S]
MSISQNINTILEKIPANVKLVAVSKTKPQEDIIEAYEGGYRVFGENKPQELVQKYNELPKDIEWHFIGHLQTNKVKYIAPFIQLIHAVDSIKLLKEINKQAEKNNRVIKCLLQFHIASEETKFGLTIDEAKELFTSEDFKSLKSIQIVGVMGMATYTNNEIKIRNEFGNLKSIFESLKSDFFIDRDEFKEISMGMSGDYMLAISEGSTMIRVGSTIFGSRY